MRIGDRVRLLKGTEEGIIVNFKGRDIVEIEIEDGFVIPALKKEVVVIDKRESQAFKEKEESVETAPAEEPGRTGYLAEGIYLGLKREDAGHVRSYIINQTEDIILYSLKLREKKKIHGWAHGVIRPFSFSETGLLPFAIFHKSTQLIVQILIHVKEASLTTEPFNTTLNLSEGILKESTWVESARETLSLINMSDLQSPEINPDELKEKMLEHPATPLPKKNDLPAASGMVVDLHIDAEKSHLSPDEILLYQLDEFEKAFDRALLANAPKLTVIHGVGAGKLRAEIHKRLSRKKEVKYFEDAAKEKFGYGATAIWFR